MLSIIILILLILSSAILSSSETAFFSLSTFTLRTYKFDVDTRKRLIARLLSRPRDLLVTIMMMNILSNILIQNTVSNIFGDYTGFFLKVGVPLFLTLFLGEIIPKSVAISNNKSISYRLSPFISFVARVLGPVRKIITNITGYISRFMFFFLKKEKPLSADELHHIIEGSKEKGVLNIDETELAAGYLDLQESIVKEHMRPKDEIIYFNIKEPLSKLLHIFIDMKCSRLPVCEGGLDKILGIITVRNFFFNQEYMKTSEDLKKILTKPFFIPETTKGWDLLKLLRDIVI